MKMTFIRTVTFFIAICCISCTASCGREVQKADESSLEISAAAGTKADDSETPENIQQTAENESTEDENNESTIEATSNKATIVTRSKDEIDKLNKPTGGSSKPSGGTSNHAGGNTDPTSGGQNTTLGAGMGISGITLSYTTAEIVVGQTKIYPTVAENISEVWTTSDASVATVDSIGNITGVGVGNCVIRVTSADDSSIGAEVIVTVKENTGVQTIDDVTYVDGILIANKSYGLPQSYNPGGLTSDTYAAFQELVQGAANDNLNIYLSSGFRSYELQEQIYNNYVEINGQATADTFSARPGYSEHQTGMAIDVNEISDAFIGTPEAIWLEEHCTEYGFIIRYPQGKQDITGYKYEPWHIRYVGKDVAKAVREAANAAGDPHLTLEEYLGIDSYYH